jgi:hypothetical protein
MCAFSLNAFDGGNVRFSVDNTSIPFFSDIDVPPSYKQVKDHKPFNMIFWLPATQNNYLRHEEREEEHTLSFTSPSFSFVSFVLFVVQSPCPFH